MQSKVIALAWFIGLSVLLKLTPIEIKDEEGTAIEARIQILSLPGRAFIAEGVATKGVFEIDEKKLMDQIKNKERVVVIVVPPNQKKYAPKEEEHEAIEVARKKFSITLRNRAF